VFGQYARGDPRHIPHDIADLQERGHSPLLVALEWLLRLPQQRCRLSELRDLLDVPAIAARFGVDAADLPRLAQWMAGAGVRWGLHAEQRESWAWAPAAAVNTGAFGLRRMLLGYASGDAAPAWDEIEPYPEVGGLDAALAGALAALLDALEQWWGSASTARHAHGLGRAFRQLLATFFSATDEADRQTLAALHDALAHLAGRLRHGRICGRRAAGRGARGLALCRGEPGLNRRFRAGGVTFCTLLPMRAIPFEVLCLLGMNDGDYPRRHPRSDFDLMGQPGQARPGDRSRRDDDRQLMLEAVLSARRVLYLSWAGRSVRDNSTQPPSVLVSQLRDYIAAGWPGDLLAARTTEHPLQPFSRRYFEQPQACAARVATPLHPRPRMARRAPGGRSGRTRDRAASSRGLAATHRGHAWRAF
jgi:exodeoxyribonuclease V gamma subunit